ncbi:MAG: DUF1287 domain-containing protein, partial [Cyclobacteriaceae bacterium]
MKKFILFVFWFYSSVSFAQDTDEHEIFYGKLVEAAIQRTHQDITYDPSYYRLDYPGGDVPANKGVCTDVVIRSYRQLDIDLQAEVHEDMKANFSKYPKNWGLSSTDRNIDHRRVPNLMTYFKRQGASKPVTDQARDYNPGDLVTWDLGGGITHIGIVVDQKSVNGHPLIVHNIGRG